MTSNNTVEAKPVELTEKDLDRFHGGIVTENKDPDKLPAKRFFITEHSAEEGIGPVG